MHQVIHQFCFFAQSWFWKSFINPHIMRWNYHDSSYSSKIYHLIIISYKEDVYMYHTGVPWALLIIALVGCFVHIISQRYSSWSYHLQLMVRHFHWAQWHSFTVVSSDRSSYSESVLLLVRKGNFFRFWAFLPIYLVFLFENWMQIDNNWPWGPWWL